MFSLIQIYEKLVDLILLRKDIFIFIKQIFLHLYFCFTLVEVPQWNKTIRLSCLIGAILFSFSLILLFSPKFLSVANFFTVWLLNFLYPFESFYWLTDWLTDWLTAWLAGWLSTYLPACLLDWLTDWLTGWLAGWLAGWLTDWLTDWLGYKEIWFPDLDAQSSKSEWLLLIWQRFFSICIVISSVAWISNDYHQPTFNGLQMLCMMLGSH